MLKSVNDLKFFTQGCFELEIVWFPANAEDLPCFLPNRVFIRRKGMGCWPLPQDSKAWFSCRGFVPCCLVHC